MTTAEAPRIPEEHEDTAERHAAALPSIPAPARIQQVLVQQAKEWGVSVLSRFPSLKPLVDKPRTQPMKSGAYRLYQWWKSPYGVPEKPASVGEVPWDYVEENQDKIPFQGLREYWYPAIESKDLMHNQPKPVTMLGDNIVLFRDADGRARALENRCPHRGPLLSLGQVGVWAPGTLTCRYHGMTFDGDGECVAFLADGPNSNACGKVRARSYPVEEHRGVVLVYMGDREPPSFMETFPHAETVFGQKLMMIQQLDLPYSHLNMLDNTVDMTHVGCLHRTCSLFNGQKPAGDMEFEEIFDGRGLHVWYTEPDEHPGTFSIDHIEWLLPNLVYHAPGDLAGPLDEGYFWFVPRDVGSFTGWLIMGKTDFGTPMRNTLAAQAINLMMGRFFGRIYPWPGSITSCIYGGDAVLQAAQGRVARWDMDRLARTDRPVVKIRRMLQAAHQEEVAERKEREEQKVHRIRRPQPASDEPASK